MTLVLIVDDVPTMAEQYAYDLKRLRGYDTLIAQSGRTALESLTRDSVDCVILDLEMPGMDGFEVLRSVERLGLRVPVIVYTGTGDYDRCAQAIRLGAYSFIDKAEPMERVAQEVENAIERRRLTAEVTLLRHGFGLESPLVGTSPALAKLKEAIVRVDRKSTRLNSSHSQISYAVFCLKKKKKQDNNLKHLLNQIQHVVC